MSKKKKKNSQIFGASPLHQKAANKVPSMSSAIVVDPSESVALNSTLGYDDLPIDMRFNEGHVVSIITYSCLMVVSAIGNITVLSLLLRRRGNAARTRINTMLIHLAIADLLVSLLFECKTMSCEK